MFCKFSPHKAESPKLSLDDFALFFEQIPEDVELRRAARALGAATGEVLVVARKVEVHRLAQSNEHLRLRDGGSILVGETPRLVESIHHSQEIYLHPSLRTQI